MEEPGGLQPMGLPRVGHDWATSLSLFTFTHWRRCSCLENPRDGGAWWAAVCGVAQSRKRLKQLSSSRIIWRVNGYLRREEHTLCDSECAIELQDYFMFRSCAYNIKVYLVLRAVSFTHMNSALWMQVCRVSGYLDLTTVVVTVSCLGECKGESTRTIWVTMLYILKL